jgi:tRNA(Ile)-lysidine synthase
MLTRFQRFVKENQLFREDDRLLLAVSGGVDSVVMAHLLKEADLNFAIAHCNFGLRGNESEGDEAFVQNLAHSLGVKCYVKKFETCAFSEEQNLSIQEAARKLRYAWFEELLTGENFSLICTAHHTDDSIETFFINLLRGTGLAGLTGVPLRNGYVVRPMLFASKADILNHAAMNALAFREDSSNEGDAYLRNRVRHSLLPLLEELNPSFRSTLSGDMQRLADARTVLDTIILQEKIKLLHADGEDLFILTDDLLIKKPLRFWIYGVLKDFGFNESVAENLEEMLLKKKHSGQKFESPEYELRVERDRFLIRRKKEQMEDESLRILRQSLRLDTPIAMRIEIQTVDGNFRTSSDQEKACLDAGKLEFPLLLRKWRTGDRFQPLGMKGSKLLSDYFSDNKFSYSQKEQVWVLESGAQIAWLVGHRIDERYRVDENTKEVMFFSLDK